MRSPGCTSDDGTCGNDAYWARDWCGMPTPAWAHDHIVSPEQSNATPGVAAANTHGTPVWVIAALMAVCARDDAGGIAGAAGAVCCDAAGASRGAAAGSPPPDSALPPEPLT